MDCSLFWQLVHFWLLYEVFSLLAWLNYMFLKSWSKYLLLLMLLDGNALHDNKDRRGWAFPFSFCCPRCQYRRPRREDTKYFKWPFCLKTISMFKTKRYSSFFLSFSDTFHYFISKTGPFYLQDSGAVSYCPWNVIENNKYWEKLFRSSRAVTGKYHEFQAVHVTRILHCFRPHSILRNL